MISFDFKNDTDSRVSALAKINKLHIIDNHLVDPIYDVPDYVEITYLASVVSVNLKVNKEGEGKIFARSVNVAMRFLDTRNGADVWVKRPPMDFDEAGEKINVNDLYESGYASYAPILWDEEYLSRNDKYLKSPNPSIKVLSTYSLIAEELKIDVDILSENQKIKVKETMQSKFRNKTTAFSIAEISTYEFHIAFGSEDYVMDHQLRRETLLGILNHRKGAGLFTPRNKSEKNRFEVLKALPSLKSFCIDTLATYGYKSMFNFILTGDTPQKQVNRAFFVNDIYKMVCGNNMFYNDSDDKGIYNALCLKDGFEGYQEAMNQVDKGAFPLSVIGVRNNLPNLSRSTLSSNLINSNFARDMSIEALPSVWFEGKYGKPFYEDMNNTLLEKHIMICAELDGYKYSKALKEKDDKTTNEISKKWEWLSREKAGKSASEKIASYDTKYKYNAEMPHTSDVLKDIINGILLRVISEIPLPNKFQDCIHCEFIEGLHIDIDWVDMLVRDDNELSDMNEIFSIEDPVSSIINAGCGVSHIAKMSKLLHYDVAGISETLAGFNKKAITFISATDHVSEMGGYEFHPLDTSEKLLAEGTIQDNCVYTRMNNCLSGECAIVSMRSKEGERVGTIQLEYDPDDESLFVESALGIRNTELSPEIRQIIDNYLTKLNSYPHTRNKFWEQENLDLNKLLSNKDTKMSTLSSISLVPFETDAAFYAYGFLDKYVPGGVDELISPDGFLDEFIKETPFGKSIQLGRELMKIEGCSFLDVTPKLLALPQLDKVDITQVQAFSR